MFTYFVNLNFNTYISPKPRKRYQTLDKTAVCAYGPSSVMTRVRVDVMAHDWNVPVSWCNVRQHLRILLRLPGPADNCWSAADIDLNSRRNPLRNFKYESYSKPEEDHFRLRIIWLLSIVRRAGQSGTRSNGWWTATYLGAIDNWMLEDRPFRQTLKWYRWYFTTFKYWEDC